MKNLILVSFFLVVSSCTSQPGVKTKLSYPQFQEKFVSEYYKGTRRMDCLTDVESPMVGYQDNFAFVKMQHQTENQSGCQIDFQSQNVDENMQAVQATLQFACWVTSFTGYANLFDYAAIDRLKITETEKDYVFQDGEVLVHFSKDLSAAEVKFKKDEIRIDVEYTLDKNNKRRWTSALMRAPLPGQKIELESRVEPIYSETSDWPEKLEVSSLGIKTEITLRNCKAAQ